MIKTLLIGCGRMGRNHLRVFGESNHFEVVGIVDPDLKASGSSSGLVGADSVTICEKLEQVDSSNFDLAVVSVPTSLHFEIGCKIIELGKDLLMEKPLALTLKQGKELVSRAKKQKIFLATGHLERMNPAVVKLSELMYSGALGHPIHFNFTRVGGYPETIKGENNVLVDLAVHDLDVLSYLAGNFEVVGSVFHNTWKTKILDTAEILLTNPSKNCSASIHVNWVTPSKIRKLRVTGTRGVCFVDYIAQTCTLYGGDLLQSWSEPPNDYNTLLETYQNSDVIEFGVTRAEPLKVQSEELYKALKGKPSLVCTGEMSLNGLGMAEKALHWSKGD